jgi:predicted amidophosphoribosyltransferase
LTLAYRPSSTVPRPSGKAATMKKRQKLYDRKPCAGCGKDTSNAGRVCGKCLGRITK